jgi:hypothetical protein
MRVPIGPLLRLVLSLGIFAAGFTPRLALCLGSDGHRAIESLDASCCRRGVPTSPGMADPCARTCTDLPLSLAVSVCSPERGGLHIDLSATAIPVDISPSMVPTSILARRGHTSAPSPGGAQRLRSIVLLC